jgi:hypothetical protein
VRFVRVHVSHVMIVVALVLLVAIAVLGLGFWMLDGPAVGVGASVIEAQCLRDASDWGRMVGRPTVSLEVDRGSWGLPRRRWVCSLRPNSYTNVVFMYSLDGKLESSGVGTT